MLKISWISPFPSSVGGFPMDWYPLIKQSPIQHDLATQPRVHKLNYISMSAMQGYTVAMYVPYALSVTVLYWHMHTWWFFLHTVPIPIVTVTLLGDQTLGQLSPTLLCSVTTVRGVNSSINIVWYSGNGTELQRVNDAKPAITNNSYVYMDTYRVSSQLNIDLNGKVYTCEAVIDSDPVIRTNNTITLDVIGEMCMQMWFVCIRMCLHR